MNGERWRPVVGYEGVYSVSSRGRIRRDQPGPGARAGAILRPAFSRTRGYAYVALSRDGIVKTVDLHRLVARAFLGEPPEGHEVNHIDGDKSNSAVANLEYLTHGDNLGHAARSGLVANGSMLPQSKLTEQKVREIRALRGIVPTRELARRYGVTTGCINDVLALRRWTHVRATA